jgi:lipopolysaccharide transport system ATP-binding protein
MRRGEIEAKFDEIVAFSEIEKFLETPVKRYSSGMYMRLAFAVAAHLEPEILVIDEVLAVGDANFQKKCLGKMSDVAKQGRTVLFVSHNMGAITSLTRKTIHLDGGYVKAVGNSDDVVAAYLQAAADTAGAQVNLDTAKSEAYFTAVEVVNAQGTPTTTLPVTEPFRLRFRYTVTRPLSGLEASFTMLSKFGHRVFSSSMSHDPRHEHAMDHAAGTYVAEAEIPALFLAPGTFTIRCGLHQPNLRIFDVKEDVIRIDIVENGSHVYAFSGADVGSVLTRFEWTRTRVDSNVAAR